MSSDDERPDPTSSTAIKTRCVLGARPRSADERRSKAARARQGGSPATQARSAGRRRSQYSSPKADRLACFERRAAKGDGTKAWRRGHARRYRGDRGSPWRPRAARALPRSEPGSRRRSGDVLECLLDAGEGREYSSARPASAGSCPGLLRRRQPRGERRPAHAELRMLLAGARRRGAPLSLRQNAVIDPLKRPVRTFGFATPGAPSIPSGHGPRGGTPRRSPATSRSTASSIRSQRDAILEVVPRGADRTRHQRRDPPAACARAASADRATRPCTAR